MAMVTVVHRDTAAQVVTAANTAVNMVIAALPVTAINRVTTAVIIETINRVNRTTRVDIIPVKAKTMDPIIQAINLCVAHTATAHNIHFQNLPLKF